MDVGSKTLFKDELDAKNFEPNLKIEVGQKVKTFHYARRNYVQNGTRMGFDFLSSSHSFM
jgi:hypothetical protein